MRFLIFIMLNCLLIIPGMVMAHGDHDTKKERIRRNHPQSNGKSDLNTYKGEIANEALARAIGISYKDPDEI